MNKRTVLFFFIVLGSFTGILTGQSITVTKPASGETWYQSQTYAIIWTKSGNMPDKVKINLKESNSSTIVLEIVDGVPNSGSYSWPIPASVAPGQYKIRVKVKNSTIVDDSGAFTIAGAAASITVTKPAADESWHRSKAYAVTWTKTGTMPDSVKVDLYDKNGTAVVKPVAAGAPNTGTYSWTVPGDTALGEYRIRVKANGANVQDDSGVFHIALVGMTPGSAAMASKKVEFIPVPQRATVADFEVIEKPAQSTAWAKTLYPGYFQPPNELYSSRPKPCPQAPSSVAKVGYDHFYGNWNYANGAPASCWLAFLYRTKVYFYVDDLMGRKDGLIEAKMKFNQIDSIRVNTNHVSCATGMGILNALWTDWLNPPVVHMIGLPFLDTEYSIDITEYVRKWLNKEEVNYGFLLVSEKEDLIQENITCMSCYEIKLVMKFKKAN